MGFASPNYTQIPNDFLENMLPSLGLAETKVLLVIFRKTFGWHRIRDRISLSQLQKLTGCNRTNILTAIDSLISKKLIIKEVVGEKGYQETFYELVIDNSNNFTQCHSSTPPQCHSSTPPSATAAPTKERIKEIEKERGREAPSAPPRAREPDEEKFEEGLVKMSKKSFDSLQSDYGARKVKEYIEKLKLYLDIYPDKAKKYKNHSSVIRSWMMKDGVQKIDSLAPPLLSKAPSLPKVVGHPVYEAVEALMKNNRHLQRTGMVVMTEKAVEFPTHPDTALRKIEYAAVGAKEIILNQLRKLGAI